MGRTNSLHPTTQIYTIQITLVINLESTDHQFGVSDYQHSLDILVFKFKYIPVNTRELKGPSWVLSCFIMLYHGLDGLRCTMHHNASQPAVL